MPVSAKPKSKKFYPKIFFMLGAIFALNSCKFLEQKTSFSSNFLADFSGKNSSTKDDSDDNFFEQDLPNDTKLAKNSSDNFIRGSQDIPLAQSLEIISENDVEFDSILGSFNSVTYQSKNAQSAISEFYVESLPKLGWQQLECEAGKAISNCLNFVREDQKLEIKFRQENEVNLINFITTTKSK